MGRATGARAQMALGFETTYGTPPVAGKFWKMPFASENLGAEQGLLASELLGYGRDPLPPVLDAITNEGDIVVPIDARYIGVWLKAIFGNPTTTGSAGAYSHEFRSGGYTLPSFAVEIGMPEVPAFFTHKGCVANSISWTMARSGLVTASVNVVAQNEAKAAATAAGTLTELALTRFGAFQAGITRDAAALGSIVQAQVNYSNNLDKIEVIRADGAIDGADPSVAALTGTLEARFADTTLLDQALNGTACALSFKYTISASVSLELVAHKVYLPRPKLALQGPGGVQATFNWQAAYDSVTGRMCTVTLKNDQATYSL